jgi:hypothetical protein
MNRKVRYAIYAVSPSVAALAIMAAAFYGYRVWNDPIRRGRDLNRTAWEATYLERGEAIPESGPRDGFWSLQLEHNHNHPDYAVRWIAKKARSPGLFDIDENGEQHWTASQGQRARIVIVGASVAWGSYASCIDRTYFNVAGRELEARGLSVALDVVATGAWKSSQELAALRWYLKRQSPRLIVLLDGLNDLTLGATASSLGNETVLLPDGSLAYHLPDYENRIAAYLANVDQAAALANGAGAKLLVVLQPSLMEKAKWTRLEEVLARNTLKMIKSGESLLLCYEAMRQGLAEFERAGKLHWFDASRLFDQETCTTFTDVWHFADQGHELLGKALARPIADLLTSGK